MVAGSSRLKPEVVSEPSRHEEPYSQLLTMMREEREAARKLALRKQAENKVWALYVVVMMVLAYLITNKYQENYAHDSVQEILSQAR